MTVPRKPKLRIDHKTRDLVTPMARGSVNLRAPCECFDTGVNSSTGCHFRLALMFDSLDRIGNIHGGQFSIRREVALRVSPSFRLTC
jgi:hypothetical protein